MSHSFTFAALQMRCSPDKKVSLKKALEMLDAAAKKKAQVACLPELFATDYFCQVEDQKLFDLAEAVDGPTADALSKSAKKHKMVIIGSIFERRAAGVYHNTVLVFEKDGSLLGIYRKMHIPDDPLFYEKFYFTLGDLGFKNFKTSYGNIGTLICWDQWYPEAARLTALQGADLIVYPTAIGWHPSEKKEYGDALVSGWETLQRSHAFANGVYVSGINRIGHEHARAAKYAPVKGDGLEFWGNSFVCDPYGRMIAKASHSKEEILISKIDPKLVEEQRRHWPFLRDRRIDAYEGITKRFGK
jgi:N-carbamoylputrescine amidase